MPQGEHACPYCQTSVATLRGVHSHIMQNKICRARMHTDDLESDSGEPELEQPAHLEVSTNLAAVWNDDDVDVDMDLGEDQDFPMGLDPPVHPAVDKNPQNLRRATVEDEIEEPAAVDDTYVEVYPRPAGTTREQGESAFAAYRRMQKEDEQSPWSPFESADEWELAQWLMTSGVSQKKVNEFLKLKKVRGYSPVIDIRFLIRI